MLHIAWNVLDNIQTVDAVMLVGKRRLKNVMVVGFQRPTPRTPIPNVLNKQWVEIVGNHLLRCLHDNAGAKSIAASEFTDELFATQHLRDEFVTCKQERQSARVVFPDLVGHKTE